MAEAMEFDSSYDELAGAGNNFTEGMERFSGDKSLYARFFMHPKQNQEKTQAQGRPIFEDVEYIEIAQPGDPNNSVIRQVRPIDRDRFRDSYVRFKSNDTESVVGTPLSAWPMITRSQVEELKYFKIHTVEQLSDLSDGLAGMHMGFVSLKRRAKDYLESAQGLAHASQLRSAMEKRDNELAAMRGTVDALRGLVEKLMQKTGGLDDDEAEILDSVVGSFPSIDEIVDEDR